MTLGSRAPQSGRCTVTIATTIDDGWLPHFATCVTSLAASKGGESVRFLMLQGPTLSDSALADLRAFVRDHGMELDPVPIPEDLLATLPPTLLFSPLVWYRLLLPDLLPDLDRVLALDADTLVLQSLAPLWDRFSPDTLVAAVGQPVTGVEARLRGLGLDPAASYFNAGVMLMDLNGMRSEGIAQRAIALGHERHQEFVFAEQDALNVLLAGQWECLHPKWNALSYLWLLPEDADATYCKLDRAAATASPAVVHFEGFQTVKPWFYRSVHPLRHLYREYRSQTPWPLTELDRKSMSGALLRPLPIRWQYGITRARARVAQLARG